MPRGHRRSSPTGIAVRFGQRVRELRAERGLSQAELARRVGTSPAHLNKLEAGGKTPTLVTVEALARGLGVGVAELIPASSRPSSATANPPDPLWARITGELRGRDHEYLLLVRDMLKLLDRARTEG